MAVESSSRHRIQAKQLFGNRAVIITQCLDVGGRSAAKDIKDSLSWRGDKQNKGGKLQADERDAPGKDAGQKESCDDEDSRERGGTNE